MSDYVGSVRFQNPLVLVSDLPSDTRGYARQTVDGRVVYIFLRPRPGDRIYQLEPYIAEWEFHHEKRSVVDNLRRLWKSSSIYGFRLDSVYGHGALALDGGISNITHASGQKWPRSVVKNTHNDKWNGKIKILVSYATIV